MLKNPHVKNVLSALVVAIFGFILLNLTFLLDFFFQNLVDRFIKFFIPHNLNMSNSWFPLMKHAMFVVIIGLISWYIFRSKLGLLYKAIYMTVPVVVVLATFGIFLYHWPLIAISVGSLLTVGTLYYFHRTKQSWLYYFSVIIVPLVLLIMTLAGGEI